MTWRPTQTPDDQAFATMKAAIERGATFWNSGEFYGQPEPTLNLQLLSRFFTKYPEYKQKVYLSVKGAANLETLQPQGKPQEVRKSVENIINVVGGKYIDMFECAREILLFRSPIEETIGELAKLVKEGKISAISLSECNAGTIRRASKVHKISAVEIEFSLWSTEARDNGVLEACKELDIPVVAYSPLGRGFLTGKITKFEDIPEGDFRRYMPRFQPQMFDQNIKLVEKITTLAQKKNCTPAQLALAWILHQDQWIIPIPGCTTPERLHENMDSLKISLSENDMKEIEEVLATFHVKGERYPNSAKIHLWG
ncbi:Pyridoxal reductase [Neolecta irregularis DAH-3]|uniref:Pyridoxal reductase n=1 Tax=Neolecta irregularis (strain DAH-3) TaxID=1198029 RepID=A0A1U7LQR6_NEOID|nr:Pyridoxal reductase [Neolecta irregularis DAH-3]|eukprot:OLL24984.1 Pyridoxal reductase [Neolecta irregularis DAH-3]